MKTALMAAVALCCGLSLAGCAKKAQEPAKGPSAANITVLPAQVRKVEVLQESIGSVDAETAPLVAAEVPGQVEKLLADTGDAVKAGQLLAVLDAGDLANAQRAAQAEVKRVEALLSNQRKLTARYRQLFSQHFVSASALDAAVSQQDALEQQAKGAQAALAQAGRNLAKARIYAPVSGKVQQRMVSKGDYVTPGKPLFQIATSQDLRVRLPFPEGVADQVRSGLKVVLTTPAAPAQAVEGRVTEIKPMIGAGNRAFEAVVTVANPGNWRPGASVNGAVVVAEHPQAVVVPEPSVVLRPAGKVVYVVADGTARQRLVKTGEKQGGMVEILTGLAAGETVAVDGAGFLTDRARVKVQGRGAAPAGDTR